MLISAKKENNRSILDEKWRFLSLSYELSLDKRLICYINPSSFAALVYI